MSERDIKGIWIPIEIWEDHNITLFETALLAEIDSLDQGEGCWKSDRELAKRMRCSLGHLKNRIHALKESGYLKTINRQNKRRYLRTCFSRHLRKNQSKREVTSKVSEKLPVILSTIRSESTVRCGTSVPRSSDGFGLNGELVSCPGTKSAKRLTNLFHRLLVKNRFHQARSDLPYKGPNQSEKKREVAIKKWKATIKIWTQVCDELIHQYQGDVQLIKKVIKWYFSHCREHWVGTYLAMTTFCENFPKIEKMMRREEHQGEDEYGYRAPKVTDEVDEEIEIVDD